MKIINYTLFRNDWNFFVKLVCIYILIVTNTLIQSFYIENQLIYESLNHNEDFQSFDTILTFVGPIVNMFISITLHLLLFILLNFFSKNLTLKKTLSLVINSQLIFITLNVIISLVYYLFEYIIGSEITWLSIILNILLFITLKSLILYIISRVAMTFSILYSTLVSILYFLLNIIINI